MIKLLRLKLDPSGGARRALRKTRKRRSDPAREWAAALIRDAAARCPTAGSRSACGNAWRNGRSSSRHGAAGCRSRCRPCARTQAPHGPAPGADCARSRWGFA
ncbi:hypothetical protein G6F32_016386 [Rhizopus arrhizus]|nr:hypothetical protein G6F32_016386 [Rhizopus arrhizus]